MKKVFVSSTIYDLIDVRAELYEFLNRNGFIPYMSEMPDFPKNGKQDSSYEKCRSALMDADIFLLILNTRYGGARDIPINDISITHQEYRWAKERNMELIIYVRDTVADDHTRWKRLGKPEASEELSTLTGKNWRVLQILEEISTGAPGGGALWWDKFSDSLDLKRKLSHALGINDYSNNYIVQAQSINALPRLIPYLYDIYLSDDLQSVAWIFDLKNFGSSIAYDINIHSRDNTFHEKIHWLDIDTKRRGGNFFINPRLDEDNIEMIIEYRNILQSRFQSLYLVPTIVIPDKVTFIEDEGYFTHSDGKLYKPFYHRGRGKISQLFEEKYFGPPIE